MRFRVTDSFMRVLPAVPVYAMVSSKCPRGKDKKTQPVIVVHVLQTMKNFAVSGCTELRMAKKYLILIL